MPCRDGGDDFVDINNQRLKTEAKLDKVTRLLCEMLRAPGGKKLLEKGSQELRDWWKEHQIYDAIRIKLEEQEKQQKEMQRKARISQLEKELEQLKKEPLK